MTESESETRLLSERVVRRSVQAVLQLVSRRTLRLIKLHFLTDIDENYLRQIHERRYELLPPTIYSSYAIDFDATLVEINMCLV